jgi:hypothetical protein
MEWVKRSKRSIEACLECGKVKEPHLKTDGYKGYTCHECVHPEAYAPRHIADLHRQDGDGCAEQCREADGSLQKYPCRTAKFAQKLRGI